MGKQGRKGKRRKLADELEKILTDNILDRYFNDEYINHEIRGKRAQKKDILRRYDHAEYWEQQIIDEFQIEHQLTDKQIKELIKVIQGFLF